VTDRDDAALERQRFFDAFNAVYERLRNDSEEWAAIQDEREAEAGALMDCSA
jgi:hypothetical protein